MALRKSGVMAMPEGVAYHAVDATMRTQGRFALVDVMLDFAGMVNLAAAEASALLRLLNLVTVVGAVSVRLTQLLFGILHGSCSVNSTFKSGYNSCRLYCKAYFRQLGLQP